jgi:RHS repeat-associated protein
MSMTPLAEHPAAKRRDNRLVEVDGVPYRWSENGNLLDDGVLSYEYDHANRLIAVSDQRSSFGFSYNGLGDRLVQTVDGAPTQYTLDLNAGLTHVLADGTNTYLYGVTRIGQQGPSGWAYHLPDALGSVRQMADPVAAAIFAQSYEPYGNVLDVSGEARTPFGFTGEWMDRTGLVHLRARYYAPYFGAFVQPDPWPGSALMPDTLHPYLYAGANPIVYRDPSGRCYGDFDFLRGIEPRACENLDMARLIFNSPETSLTQKAGALGYASLWSTGHIAIGGLAIIGAVVAPEIAAGGTLIGGGYSVFKYQLAQTGSCGCEAQEAALSQDPMKVLRQGSIQGFLGGGLFGVGGVFGAVGEVVAGTTGFGASTYGAATSIADIWHNKLNPCNAADLIASVAGMYGTGRYTYGKLPQARVQVNELVDSRLAGLTGFDLPPELQPPGVTGQWKNWSDEVVIQVPQSVNPWIGHIQSVIGPRVPSAWGRGMPNRKGLGWRWIDPINPSGNGVRIDKGNNLSYNPSQRVDHVVVRYNGQVIGRDGAPIVGSIAENPIQAHIPLYEYLNWADWYKP